MARRVLVGEDRQAGDDAAAAAQRRQRLGQGGGAVGVVGGVDEGRRVLGDPLEAAGDRQRSPPPPRHGRGIELAEEGLGGCAGEGEVAALEASRRQQSQLRAGVLRCPQQAGAALGRGALGQRLDRGRDPAQHQRRLVAQHRQLLGRDLQLGLPQPLGVVESDRGQHRDPRGDRVGRVEPAPEPGLDRRDLDPSRSEGDEGRRRRRLELGHRVALVEAAVDALGGRARPARPRSPTPPRRPPRRGSASARPSCAVWGERQAPAPTPWASSSAAVIRATEDLPLVPTTWIEAKRCWGMPSAVVSLYIRSRPSRQPIGSSESR